MLTKVKFKIGDEVSFLYPVHGKMNILRKVVGEAIDSGTGPNGPFLTIQETNGKIRSCSKKKMVFI
jgi:hypothetical protein